MIRRTLPDIVGLIKSLLESEKELSVRQISIKTQTQWRTAIKALELMKSLGIVKEHKGITTKREERIFSLMK